MADGIKHFEKLYYRSRCMTESESVSACVLKKKQLAKQLDERSGEDSHVSTHLCVLDLVVRRGCRLACSQWLQFPLVHTCVSSDSTHS